MKDTANTASTLVHVAELDCAAEEAVLQRVLGALPGVHTVVCNVVNRRVVVTHEGTDDAEILNAIKSAGMSPTLVGDSSSGTGTPALADTESRPSKPVLLWTGLGVSGLLAVGAELTAWTTGAERSWPVITMAVGSILLGGLPTLRKGFYALKSFTLNINFLMSVAVIGACAIGQWPEAAMVVFLFAVAELIERYALERGRNAVRALMQLAPQTALVQQADGSWQEVPAADVRQDSTVRVKPGERLALDGVVVSGASAVNQAPITGESVPVDKVVGDQVFAGTINGEGVLEFRTTGGSDQTTLARIIRTVQDAQGARAPTQRFVDSFARVYTPIVFVLALLLAIVPWLFFTQPFLPWMYKSLVLLVIACPCALVISTPVTVVSGLTAAARRGILIKGGVFLEQGRKLRMIALDKTGTITEGKPVVTDVIPLAGSREDVLRIAASLDALSDHPVARAVAAAWTGERAKVEDFRSITGRGVEGSIGGKRHVVGNHRLAHERNVCSPAVEAELARLEQQGKTAIVLADEASVIGMLAVADTPRPTSIEAVKDLHALGLATAMLSGDNSTTAAAIARIVGIDDARGGLLPEDKLTAIDELKHRYGEHSVGMVGDGVNDAPALAKASVAFAMGAAGTDTTLETASVALMRDDLRGVPEFVRLSRRTGAALRQNIGLALGLKAVVFGLALVGIATLWMAVVADVGASLLVVGNGLRLLRGASSRNGDARDQRR